MIGIRDVGLGVGGFFFNQKFEMLSLVTYELILRIVLIVLLIFLMCASKENEDLL